MSVYSSTPYLDWEAPREPAPALICLEVLSTPLGIDKPQQMTEQFKAEEMLNYSGTALHDL